MVFVLSTGLAGCGRLQDGQPFSESSGSQSAAAERIELFKVENGQAFLVLGAELEPGGRVPRLRKSSDEAHRSVARAQLEEALRRRFLDQPEPFSARLAALWFRTPIQWSLNPEVVPVVLSPVQIPEPPAAVVTDGSLNRLENIGFPRADGVFLYRWTTEHVNGTASFDETVLRYTVTDGVTRATLEASKDGGETFTLIYQGTPLGGLQYTSVYVLAPGLLGLLDDPTIEAYVIGTYTVTENLNGVQNQGQFDLRMLAVKNLRAEREQSTQATENPPSTITADLCALPPSTGLFREGWQPAGPVAWRVSLLDQNSPPEIRVLLGESPVSAPDSKGRVASISTSWDGLDDQGEPRDGPDVSVQAQALAPLSGGGDAKSRAQKVPLNPTILEITRIEFPSAYAIMDDEGQPIAEPTLYYSQTGDVHHPVAIPADSFTISARSDWSGRHVPGGGDIVVRFDLHLEGRHDDQPATYELRVLDPDGETLAEGEVVTFPPGQDTITGFPIPFHLEKKVQGIRFIKFERRQLDPPGPWERMAEGLNDPLYVTLTTPKPPLNTTDRKPTTGLLDIATHLAAGATRDTEVRELTLQTMAGGWLASKKFTYNIGNTHFTLYGTPASPTGGEFDYVTFMVRYNGPTRFWEGECEDLACLYQLCCATAGADMNLIQVTGAGRKGALESFTTHPARSTGFQEVGNAVYNPKIPVYYITPIFRVWSFPQHQCGSFAGLVYDPTLWYSQPPPEHLVNGVWAGTWFSQHLVWTADFMPAYLRPEFPLTDVVLP